MTAAHCTLKDDIANPSKMEITLGDYDENIKEGTEQVVYASEVIQHEEYNKTLQFSVDAFFFVF